MLNDLNLSGVYDVLLKNTKRILLFVLLATAAGTLIAFLIPKQYAATATLLAGNSLMADKTVIFSENRLSPVSNLGSAEDIDRVTSVATLDTVFKIMVDSFHLVEHYNIQNKGDSARYEALVKLKEKRCSIRRTDEKQIKIDVWDTNKQMAIDMANAIAAIAQRMNQEIINKSNISALHRLEKTYQQKEAELLKSDSLFPESRLAITSEMGQLHKLMLQYNVAITDQSETLMIIESASYVYNADRPKKIQIIFTSFIASLAFSILLVLILNRKKLWDLA